jgi:succinoglycan biosynthesis protein ExoA
LSREHARTPPAANNRTSVSVIMPIRNEAGFIPRSLGAVLAQDYPADQMEVLIADGMSTDGTRDVIARLIDAAPKIPVTVVDNPGKIVPTGFNRALARATGDVIMRVDGHTVIAPGYVRECVDALRRSGADNVGGRVEAIGDGWFGRAVALATSSRFGVGGARWHYSDREEWVDTVPMGAWPRSVFERIGPFDEEQVRNQDDEFNYRLLSRGGKILLSPRIKLLQHNRSTLRSLWRQYYQYGVWKVRVMQKHPRQMRPRQFVPPVFVAVLAVSLLLAPVSTFGSWVLGLTATAYTAANLVASFWTGRKGSWLAMSLLPAAFATLHVAYGLGFVVGLVRFSARWRDRASRWPTHTTLPV